MKKTLFGLMILGTIILTGCDNSHNFMDVDNPNAKEDLKHYVSDVKIPKIDTEEIVPESLSGARNDAKGYANKYYEDTLEEYVNVARDGLSGAKETVKGFYNDSVDDLNQMISDKVNSTISGELNKFKIK